MCKIWLDHPLVLSVCVLPGYVRHLFGFRVGPVCQLQIYMRGQRKFTVTFTEKSVTLLLLRRGWLSCNVGLRGVGFHRTGRRRAASYQWYDAAILLGLNTFGTLGHTCFALPEQPPCAPCFARTHSNSISLWTCTSWTPIQSHCGRVRVYHRLRTHPQAFQPLHGQSIG